MSFLRLHMYVSTFLLIWFLYETAALAVLPTKIVGCYRHHLPLYMSSYPGQLSIKKEQIWWKDGVKFGCTACGRCCQNDGEVWLDSDEFCDLVTHLQLPASSVIDLYAEKVVSGWVKLKNKVSKDLHPNVSDQCVFLDDDGKRCTVYEARPVQCRTYPYWPRLLVDQSAFMNEAVVPDNIPVNTTPGTGARHWSAAMGGCEGIGHPDAALVPSDVIHRNHELYRSYNGHFPLLTDTDDTARLLARAGVIAGVIRSTRAWVEQFVIRYRLCPFAERVFGSSCGVAGTVMGGPSSSMTRCRVFLGSDKRQIVEKLRFEVLALLSAREDEVATTLLMLPFAFQDFESWYEFTLELEDEVLPLIEKAAQGPAGGTGSRAAVTDSRPRKTRKTLLQRALEAQGRAAIRGTGANADYTENSSSSDSSASVSCATVSQDQTVNSPHGLRVDSLPEIQLAFFHPSFEWADSEDFDSPLNFEKRSPFPTINLLRAARVREYANENKTRKISESNYHSLEEAGSKLLVQQLEEFLRLAIE